MNLQIIKLTEQQLRDLKIFLERVELRGVEAVRFTALVQSINAAQAEAPSKNQVDTEIITLNV
jgi:hypothetical protein